MNQVSKKEKTVINVGIARGYWSFSLPEEFFIENLKTASVGLTKSEMQYHEWN